MSTPCRARLPTASARRLVQLSVHAFRSEHPSDLHSSCTAQDRVRLPYPGSAAARAPRGAAPGPGWPPACPGPQSRRPAPRAPPARAPACPPRPPAPPCAAPRCAPPPRTAPHRRVPPARPATRCAFMPAHGAQHARRGDAFLTAARWSPAVHVVVPLGFAGRQHPGQGVAEVFVSACVSASGARTRARMPRNTSSLLACARIRARQIMPRAHAWMRVAASPSVPAWRPKRSGWV